MSKIALITGISGQDGSYLCDLLIGKGYEVHGVVRRTSNLRRNRIENFRSDPAIYQKKFFLHYSDLSDMTTLRRIFSKVKPDEFYHLAGQSHVGLSFEIPESTCEEVALATLRLLEICRDQSKSVRIYHASSSEVFGIAKECPQNESTPFRPTTPYGCSKAFATQIAQVYRNAYGLFICNGILYNHETPRRGENFVTRKISKQAAAIKLGLATELKLGALESRRDWGHARDYVQAMWLMLQHSTPDDYVVASGISHSVLDFVKAAFRVVDLPWEKYVSTNRAFERPLEPYQLIGSTQKIMTTLGWKPTASFDDLVTEMVKSDLMELQEKPLT